jgi:hypothetical protein
VLLHFTPGGFEQFAIELSEPTPPAGPPDMEKWLLQVMALATQYNFEVLGPLPE